MYFDNVNDMETNVPANLINNQSKEAYYYVQMPDSVRCLLCPNQCILKPGKLAYVIIGLI